MARASTLTSNSTMSLGTEECPTAVQEGGSEIPCCAESFRSHAAVLNNVGSILLQRGNLVDAMRVFREAVQTLIQASNNTDCRLNKKRQDEMQDYLNYLLTSKDHLERVTQLEQSAKRSLSMNVAVVGSREFVNLVQPTCYTKHVPGLFQSSSRFKFSQHSGNQSPFVLSFANPYTVILQDKKESFGQCDETFKTFKTNSSIDTVELAMDHVNEAIMFNMGLIHAQWGSSESALQFFQLAVSVSTHQEKEVASNLRNPVVLASLSNLGQIYCQCGRLEEAMNVFSDASARARAAAILLQADHQRNEVGKMPPSSSVPSRTKPKRNHPKIIALNCTLARILVGLANVQFCFCAYDDARTSCEDALRLLRGQSKMSLDALGIWFNLAMIHEHKQQRPQALVYYERYLKQVLRLVGPEHPNVADALVRIGCVYYDMGQLHKSLAPLLTALSIRGKSLERNGTENVDYSMEEIYNQIGKVLLGREEYEDASRAFGKALEIQHKASQDCSEGSSNFCEVCLTMSETLLNVGRLHHGFGRFEDSLRAYREVLGISIRIFGKDDLQTARLRVIIANLELELGQLSEAMSSFEEAARIELEHRRRQGHEEDATPYQHPTGAAFLARSMVKVKNPLVRVQSSHRPCAACA